MTKSPGRFHTPSKLPASLNQHLNLYALAASAAGVSLLALAQPSEAKIVYTKTHQVIGTNGLYPLDLNHDGTIDFLIKEEGHPFSFSGSGSNGLGAKEAFGNAVQGSNRLASALSKGASIGSRQRFISSTWSFGEVMFKVACSAEAGCATSGKWANVSNRYLGLRFQIDGKIHYGWARLSVAVQRYEITATLTGYAYETIPNKEIHAGQTHGTDDALTNSDAEISESARPIAPPALQPASLGRLARGTQYVPLGRTP
jgi:hypothetical protein